MVKKARSKHRKQHPPDPPTKLDTSAKNSYKVPLWQAILLPVTAILVFFLLLEGGLALFGQKPVMQDNDPFVGFAANVPLFVPSRGPDGKLLMTTAPNKKHFFNRQQFTRIKLPGTYRIFCLGGSTTYGRPYDDTTSFAGWLRELLPRTEKNKNWEVINGGGISYASYRVAHLMEELKNYQPDLFIIYTGHNEFLEERTYHKIKEIPSVVRSTISRLAKTRTWSAMTSGLQILGIYPREPREKRSRLAAEVTAILDRSAGLDRYTRDDLLQKSILQHYRVSLERMVEIARSVNAQVIFVTPGSNLKDCSPFKSEHTDGLDGSNQQRLQQIIAKAEKEIQQKNWPGALSLLENGTALDPRHAGLQYLRGKVLLAMKRYAEAESALRLARDEDVCPLRALTPMRRIVLEVAGEQNVAVVDFVALLEQHMQQTYGYDIPGKELFLDHVHPTIEGHKILAVALVRKMIEKGLVQPEANWYKDAIAAVEAKIRGSIDAGKYGLALANLARISLWAKKIKDAERLALQALEMGGDDKQVTINATSTLVTVALNEGEPEQALQQLYSAIEKVPGAVELHLKLGQVMLNQPFEELEKAAANFLLVSHQMPDFAWAHFLFGMAMVKQGRPRIAYPSLKQALRLNPNNHLAQKKLEEIRPLVQEKMLNPKLASTILDTYNSASPRRLVQVRRDASGNQIPDGIAVEFYENGRLKRFRDMKQGKPDGVEMTWDTNGELISSISYQ